VAGSIVLAAILLKLGGYGLIRAVTLFPAKYRLIYSPLSSLALTGAVVTSLICLRQTDLKSLIAYSSVGHIGFNNCRNYIKYQGRNIWGLSDNNCPWFSFVKIILYGKYYL
jgi:NADH:ubiquinone oxidoreductase subunit 4 (subunit M)